MARARLVIEARCNRNHTCSAVDPKATACVVGQAVSDGGPGIGIRRQCGDPNDSADGSALGNGVIGGISIGRPDNAVVVDVGDVDGEVGAVGRAIAAGRHDGDGVARAGLVVEVRRNRDHATGAVDGE